ncbi:MAG: hypothetical protein BGN93_02975, partial [Acinetobacter sp. 39-4]
PFCRIGYSEIKYGSEIQVITKEQLCMKIKSLHLSQTQWFIILWLLGFFALAIIAGLFRLLLMFAY